MLNMKQKKIQFDHECNLVNLHTFNFIRDLQWNNMEMEVEAIQDCMFRFWDQKDFMERLFKRMENSSFLSNSEFKNQGIIQLWNVVDINVEHKMQNGKHSK